MRKSRKSFKRFHKRKRTFKKKGFRKKVVSRDAAIIYRGVGWPDRYRCYLTDTFDTLQFGNGTNAATARSFYINTLYSPDGTNISQIPGFAELKLLYNVVRVIGVKCKFMLANADPSPQRFCYGVATVLNTAIYNLAVTTSKTAMTQVQYDGLCENHWFTDTVINVNDGGGYRPIVKWFDFRKVTGNPLHFMADDRYQANTGGGGLAQADPQNLLYLVVACSGLDGQPTVANAVTGAIRIKYYVEFTERNNPIS